MKRYDDNKKPNRGAVVIPFPIEPWVTKKQLADHFNFSTRWVELRVAEGMPCCRFAGQPRFKISEAEAWFMAKEATA